MTDGIFTLLSLMIGFTLVLMVSQLLIWSVHTLITWYRGGDWRAVSESYRQEW